MFGAVADLLGKRCGTAGCHDGDPMHTNLTKDGLHARLMTTPPKSLGNCPTQTLVVPNMPEKSLLLIKVAPESGPRNGCGSRMPLNCNGGQCLSDADVASIRNWILAGAPQ